MPPWIWAVIAGAIDPIKRTVRDIIERIAVLWGTITRVFSGIRGAWSNFYFRVQHIKDAIFSAFREAYTTLWWILKVWLPRGYRQLRQGILHWVQAGLRALERLARGLVATAQRILSRIINAVRDWAARAFRLIGHLLSDIWATLRRVRDIVFGLLLDPGKLAAWAAAAMTTAILRYLNGRKEAIGRWLLRGSVAFTIWFAQQVDNVIGRIL